MKRVKLCIIDQPAGLGDIFFCQKIGVHYEQQGYKIIWPIKPVFSYLPKYLVNFFYPISGSPEVEKVVRIGSCLHLKLDGCTTEANEIMRGKYRVANIDYRDWAEYFEFKRNTERENRLCEHFKIRKGEKFNLVNCNFASPPNTERINVAVTNNYRTINMEFLGFDNIFDWCELLERAEEIHTVNTSICYMIEKLQTTDKLFMYKRKNYLPNWDFVQGIYKKNWSYC